MIKNETTTGKFAFTVNKIVNIVYMLALIKASYLKMNFPLEYLDR